MLFIIFLKFIKIIIVNQLVRIVKSTYSSLFPMLATTIGIFLIVAKKGSSKSRYSRNIIVIVTNSKNRAGSEPEIYCA